MFIEQCSMAYWKCWVSARNYDPKIFFFASFAVPKVDNHCVAIHRKLHFHSKRKTILLTWWRVSILFSRVNNQLNEDCNFTQSKWTKFMKNAWESVRILRKTVTDSCTYKAITFLFLFFHDSIYFLQFNEMLAFYHLIGCLHLSLVKLS